MNTATFIAAAGVDPYAKADEIISARPAEVHALGEAFQQAAAAMSESGGLAGIAASLADASTAFDGASPTELSTEVQAVQASLNAGPEQLAAIGGPLCQLAAALWQVQLEVSAVLMAMEEECVCVVLSYQAAQAVPLAAPLDLAPQFTSQGAAVAHGAHQQITGLVDAHDAVADSILISLQDAGYLIPPDVDAAVIDTLGATDTPQCPALPTGDPAQIAAWWASRTPEEQAQLIQQHPGSVAQLAGLPPEVYDLVNRREMADDHIPMLPEVQSALQTLYDEGLIEPGATIEEVMALHHSELTKIGLFSIASNNALNTLKDLFPTWQKVTHTQSSVAGTADVEHYLLEYEIDAHGGDGEAVIAIGEVDSAENIAVVVQGATHDQSTIDAQTADAQAVLDQMNEHGEANAVIVYAGYDNPDISQAAFSANAQAGGSELADDLDGYLAAYAQQSGAQADPHLTVIGHSYGTTTSAYALQAGANEYVDAFVAYGSPGLDVAHASELGLPDGQVYAAITPSDVLDVLDELEDQLQMHTFGLSVLGMDPAGPGFGATVLSTQGVEGHGDYFGYDDGVPNDALYNAGAISAGEYGKTKE